MRYKNHIEAVFLERLNRFAARVLIEGCEETVHVKNTGRCRELLLPGAEVYLTAPGTPGRKTLYDLIAVRKRGGALFNIDSQAPNAVVLEWLEASGAKQIKPEYRFGDSRIDFYFERQGHKALMEVKGCTLEIGGIGYFPDAPTERGLKHLRELMRAKEEGYEAYLAFVLQMNGVSQVRPNMDTHPTFGAVLKEALDQGVRCLMLACRVEEDSLSICGVRELKAPELHLGGYRNTL